MKPDSVRPPGELAVRVVAAFDDVAARGALYSGDRPVRELVFWLTPKHRDWESAVDVLPHVGDSDDQDLVIAPLATIELLYTSPESEPWWPGPTIWPAPRLIVQRSKEPQPLSVWPDDVSALLEIAAAHEQDIASQVMERVTALRRFTKRWLDSLEERVAEREELAAEWAADDALNDEVFGGTADAEIAVLLESLRHLRGIVDAGPSLSDRSPEAPVGEFVLVDPRLVRAEHAVQLAFEEIRPKVVAREAQKRAAAKRKTEEAEALEWATTFGSSRLKMAVEAGILDQSLGIYRDERLRRDRPGWMWVAESDRKELNRNRAVNPAESSIRALLDAKQFDPNAYLSFHTGSRVQVLVASYLGRRIWRPAENEDWGPEDLDDFSSLVVHVEEVFRNHTEELF